MTDVGNNARTNGFDSLELAVNDSASGGAFGERVNFTGVITDTLCLDWAQPELVNVTTNARNHTRNCILECFDFGSGFTMLRQIENASMPEGFEYRGMYNTTLIPVLDPFLTTTLISIPPHRALCGIFDLIPSVYAADVCV